MKTRILPLVCIFGLLAGCGETSTDSLCVARLKGRVVSNGPACAGVAIEIVSGGFDPTRVDTTWFNEYSPNPIVYENVFKTYPFCSTTGEADELLLDAYETGAEFYFIFDGAPFCDFGDCPICEPLVSLPQSINKILLVKEECNDFVVIEE